MNPTHPRLANGRYVVRRCIGTGGMGAVFLAFDDVLKGQRAIKVLKPELAAHPESRARFRTEAVAMAKLTHPGIVRVFDQGQEALTAFLVMEYLPSGSLQAALRSGGPLSTEEALSVCLDVAEALDHAHQSGVIHRDIKPDNILLGDQSAKLTDFGLARVASVDGGLTRSGATFGTPSFMPPEQRLDGKNTTARSDVYSLCATLFVLVTQENPIDLYERDARDRMLAGVDPRIASLVRRGCDANPEARFESAAALVEALDAARDVPGAPRARPKALPSETHGQTQDLVTLNRLWRSFTTPNATAVPAAHGDNETHAFFESKPPPQPGRQAAPKTQADPHPVAPPDSSVPAAPPPTRRRRAPLVAAVMVGLGVGVALLSRLASDPEPLPIVGENLDPQLVHADVEATVAQPTPDDTTGGRPVPDPAADAWRALLDGSPFEAARAAAPQASADPERAVLRAILASLDGQPAALQAAVRQAKASTPSDSPWSRALSLADLGGSETLAPAVVADRLAAWQVLLGPGTDPRAEVLFLVSLHPHLSAAQRAETLQRARDRHPTKAVFAWLQGVLGREQRSLRDQETLVADALKDFPTVSALQAERGRLLLRRGALALAGEVLTQASNLQPGDPALHTLLAVCALRTADQGAFFTHLHFATDDSASESQQLAFLWQTGEAAASVGQPAEANKLWHAELHLSPDAVALHRMRAAVRASRTATLLNSSAPAALGAAQTALGSLALSAAEAAPLHAALAYDAGVQAVRRSGADAAAPHLAALQALAENAVPGSHTHTLVALLELEALLASARPEDLDSAVQQRNAALAGRCSGAWMAARVAARQADLTTLADAQQRLVTVDCRGPELEARLYTAEATVLLAEVAARRGDADRVRDAQEAFSALWPTPEDVPLAQRMMALAAD